jgi:hypothetical protein
MRIVVRLVLCFLLLNLFAQAGDQAAPDLKARADSAQGSERVTLSVEYARRELEQANTLYTSGDVEKAEASVQEVIDYSRKATEAATGSNKRLKQTEIDLRKIEHRLRDIGQSLSVDDRPTVDKAVQELEQLRANLLAKMFGEKAEPKDKSL